MDSQPVIFFEGLDDFKEEIEPAVTRPQVLEFPVIEIQTAADGDLRPEAGKKFPAAPLDQISRRTALRVAVTGKFVKLKDIIDLLRRFRVDRLISEVSHYSQGELDTVAAPGGIEVKGQLKGKIGSGDILIDNQILPFLPEAGGRERI